jgi:acyl carrier protein
MYHQMFETDLPDRYQICKDWLKAREGHVVDEEDSQHYLRILTLLKEIVEIMEEITSVIQVERLKKLEIFERVRTLTAEKLGVEPEQIKPEANLVNHLGADSLDIKELVMAFEDSFKVEIPDETIESMLTIQQVVNYIRSRVTVESGV